MFFRGIKRDIKWLKEDIEALKKRTEHFEKYEKLFYQVMENYENNMTEGFKRLEGMIKKGRKK